MEDADFSDEFLKFIQANVPSVDVLERLLALYRDQSREPAPSSQDAALFVLLRSTDPVVQEHLRILAKADVERPVTLIRLIYALRDRKIRSFAEAFRLRKD